MQFPFLNAVMELSNSSGYNQDDELRQVVETMGNVTLPLDFWDEFRSEVGDTDELQQNHELLEKLTSVNFSQFYRFLQILFQSISTSCRTQTNFEIGPELQQL